VKVHPPVFTAHQHSAVLAIVNPSICLSVILQSVIGRQGLACRHIILLAASLKYSKTLPPKSPKVAVVEPQCSLTPQRRRTPANIRMNLIFPETRVIGLHFCLWQYGSIFIQICAVGSKRRIYSATECWPKTDFNVK